MMPTRLAFVAVACATGLFAVASAGADCINIIRPVFNQTECDSFCNAEFLVDLYPDENEGCVQGCNSTVYVSRLLAAGLMQTDSVLRMRGILLLMLVLLAAGLLMLGRLQRPVRVLVS